MRIIFFSALLMTPLIGGSATPVDGFYSSIFGGVSYLPNNINTLTHDTSHTNVYYQTGYHAGGSIGFKSNFLRYEADITYIDARVKKFSANNILGPDAGGRTNTVLTMANVYYDFPDVLPVIEPILGVGLGYGYIDTRLTLHNLATIKHYQMHDNVFSYQLTSGIVYNFSENRAINLAYRYIGTDRSKELGRRFQANSVTIGVMYRFDEFSYK
jgi:opacity protein-like surface antigen